MNPTSAAAPPSEVAAPKGLVRRALGVAFSPRATYAAIAAHPATTGALAAILLMVAVPTVALLSTEIGRTAFVDQAATAAESFGVRLTDQRLGQIQAQARYAPYTVAAAQVVVVPLTAAVLAGLASGILKGPSGGSFPQAFAIAVHSFFLIAFQAVLVAPLNYARQSLSSATSLALVLPAVDDASLLGRFLGGVDLFRLWWLISLSMGFGVLYGRRTGPIAVRLVSLYVLIVLVFAAVRTVLNGA